MHSRTSDGDDEACPVCGQAYDQRIVVERGDGWADVFGGPPLTFLKRYRRWCTGQHDVERDAQRRESERVVYFHDKEP